MKDYPNNRKSTNKRERKQMNNNKKVNEIEDTSTEWLQEMSFQKDTETVVDLISTGDCTNTLLSNFVESYAIDGSNGKISIDEYKIGMEKIGEAISNSDISDEKKKEYVDTLNEVISSNEELVDNMESQTNEAAANASSSTEDQGVSTLAIVGGVILGVLALYGLYKWATNPNDVNITSSDFMSL